MCQFYIPCLERLHGWSAPKRLDTLVCSRLLYPDRFTSPIGGNSLGEWGEFLRYPKGGHTDWTRYSDEMAEYCGNDVLLCKQIYRYLQKRWARWQKSITLEHEVSDIIAKMTWNGVTINTKAATHLYQLANNERVPLLEKLNESFPPRVEEMKTPEYYYVHVGDLEPSSQPRVLLRRGLRTTNSRASRSIRDPCGSSITRSRLKALR